MASPRVDTPRGLRAKAPLGAGGTITPEVYEAARTAYLSVGTVAAIREATGLGQRAAQRLLDSGEPRIGLPSLRDAARAEAAKVERRLRQRERQAAEQEAKELAKTMEQRAKAARAAREHESKVLGDAVQARKEEVQLVRLNRISSTVLAQINADLLRTSSKVAKSLLEADLSKVSVRERLTILRTVAGIVHRTAQASAAAVNMERLLMGEPTAILGRADAPGPSTADMTPEEAEQWLAIANRAFKRRAERKSIIEAEVVEESSAETGGADAEEVLDLVEDL